MSARIIDGKAISAEVRERLKQRAERLARQGIRPGLAVVLAGADPASMVYVRQKAKACEQVGVACEIHRFAEDVEQSCILDRVAALNADQNVHGVIVQLPLPRQIDIQPVLQAIAQKKDVDGFHLYNVGGLIIGEAPTVFPPCTPYGVQYLLEHEGIEIAGRNVAIVGASNIVGKPMGLMLLRKEATVSICHIKTKDLAQFTIAADILIVAAGKPHLIIPQMVKTGAVVIDVGINRLPDGRLVGDVDFDGVRQKASYITPVPGGVGPMTVTMLIRNTIEAAERSLKANTEKQSEPAVAMRGPLQFAGR